MAKHWEPRRPRRQKPPKQQSPPKELVLLDKFSVEDIKKWKQFQNEILKLHWDYYSSLAHQRSKIHDEIKAALLYASQREFKFEKWQRTLKYKYSSEPLSVRGSLTDPGGRFNIGDIDSQKFPPFPALYIASNKDTALQEYLSQKIAPGQEASALDFALTNPESIATVSLSGILDSIINLNEPDELAPLMDLFKSFSVPEHVQEASRNLGLGEQFVLKTVPQLVDALLQPDWRTWPMHFDVPVASQIFGQMVMDAGIEGILYPSKFTQTDCLVIFPQNFDFPEKSYVQLDDEAPSNVKVTRLDVTTWELQQKLL